MRKDNDKDDMHERSHDEAESKDKKKRQDRKNDSFNAHERCQTKYNEEKIEEPTENFVIENFVDHKRVQCTVRNPTTTDENQRDEDPVVRFFYITRIKDFQY